jgi:hypothetical protein
LVIFLYFHRIQMVNNSNTQNIQEKKSIKNQNQNLAK